MAHLWLERFKKNQNKTKKHERELRCLPAAPRILLSVKTLKKKNIKRK